jgi:hypothetical protein
MPVFGVDVRRRVRLEARGTHSCGGAMDRGARRELRGPSSPMREATALRIRGRVSRPVLAALAVNSTDLNRERTASDASTNLVARLLQAKTTTR